MIVACDINNGIGYAGCIPWHYCEDLQHFKEKTINNIVIMGNGTFKSLSPQQPLCNRINIVLTKDTNPPSYYRIVGEEEDTQLIYKQSIDDALEFCKSFPDKQVWVIGGGSVYQQFLDMGIVDEIHMTRVNKLCLMDTFFPYISASEWALITSKPFQNKDLQYTVFQKLRWYKES